MFRYIAIVWNDLDSEQSCTAENVTAGICAASPDWSRALDVPGMRVFCRGMRERSVGPCGLHDNGGVVLGTLFPRSSDVTHIRGSKTTSFDAATTARILASQGREFIRHYWGNYVAILRDVPRRGAWVLRGPLSTLPCFHSTFRSIHICFSFMDDYVRLGLHSFSIDWDYVAVQATLIRVKTANTGVREISEIQPGECLEIRDNSIARRPYWDPREIASTAIVDNADEAAALLRSTVRQCVHAWASCHRAIMANISGGLDSSIMLSCLRDAPTRPHIICMTEYSDGARSDERMYTRLLASEANWCTYVEHERDPNVSLEGILDTARVPIGQSMARRVDVSATHARYAREYGATAILSGSGGDDLFFKNARSSVADFVYRHGIRPSLLGLAYRGAQLERLSIWRILAWSIYHGFFPPQRFDPVASWLHTCTLLDADLVDGLRIKCVGDAPWQCAARNIPIGKLAHISSLSGLHFYYDPVGREEDPEHIAPLLSQPLVEVALRIPTYVLMVDGRDRGLARRAFADDLPSEIIRRRDKGGMDEHIQQVFRMNLPFARRLLLDGQLVQRRFLDRAKLADALTDRPWDAASVSGQIVACLDLEAWLRRWIQHEQPTAA